MSVEYLPVRSPAELAAHVDLLCDRLEALWPRWCDGEDRVLDEYRDAAAQLTQASMRLEDLEPPLGDDVVGDLFRMLVDAGGWVLTGNEEPSLAGDFKVGIARRREAAAWLRAF